MCIKHRSTKYNAKNANIGDMSIIPKGGMIARNILRKGSTNSCKNSTK